MANRHEKAAPARAAAGFKMAAAYRDFEADFTGIENGSARLSVLFRDGVPCKYTVARSRHSFKGGADENPHRN